MDHIWNADFYAENSSLQEKWAYKIIQLTKIQRNATILDIGSGDGRITNYISNIPYTKKVVGIDPSLSMYNKAKKIENSKLTFINSDIANLSSNYVFDQIFSFSVFHWINDHLSALKKIHIILRHNGTINLFFCFEHSKNMLNNAVKKISNSPIWNSFFDATDANNFSHLLTKEQIKHNLKQSNFKINNLEIIHIKEQYSKINFTNWIKGWLPHLSYLPIDIHDNFLEAIVKDYTCATSQNSNDNIIYYGDWIWIDARSI